MRQSAVIGVHAPYENAVFVGNAHRHAWRIRRQTISKPAKTDMFNRVFAFRFGYWLARGNVGAAIRLHFVTARLQKIKTPHNAVFFILLYIRLFLRYNQIPCQGNGLVYRCQTSQQHQTAQSPQSGTLQSNTQPTAHKIFSYHV